MQRGYVSTLSVMIAEDNAFMRTTIRRVLETLGVKGVREAGDGAEALKIMQTWAPDIVLLDWEMAPLDGMEFTKMVRTAQTSADRFIPIIVISAHSELWRIAAARDAGVTEYLAKPISAKTLLSRIRAVAEQPRPFVSAPGFFGPDRRRRDLPHRDERRTRNPEELAYEGPLAHGTSAYMPFHR